MSKIRGKKQPGLKVRENDSHVLLHPADDDLFVRTGRQVIEACRLGIGIDLWLSELDSMLERVRDWAGQHASRIRSCFCAPRGSQIALYFSPALDRFDFDLADELASLNGELVKYFNIGMIEIHQVPESELDRFIDQSSARLVYGQHRKSHPPVEA